MHAIVQYMTEYDQGISYNIIMKMEIICVSVFSGTHRQIFFRVTLVHRPVLHNDILGYDRSL